MFKVQRTGNTMGAEVTGADLSRPLDEVAFRAVQKRVPAAPGRGLSVRRI